MPRDSGLGTLPIEGSTSPKSGEDTASIRPTCKGLSIGANTVESKDRARANRSRSTLLEWIQVEAPVEGLNKEVPIKSRLERDAQQPVQDVTKPVHATRHALAVASSISRVSA